MISKIIKVDDSEGAQLVKSENDSKDLLTEPEKSYTTLGDVPGADIPPEFTSQVSENTVPKIKDSGNRRKFSSGAVRDIVDGKGRCDLVPLDVAVDLLFRDDWDSESIDASDSFSVNECFIDILNMIDDVKTSITEVELEQYTAQYESEIEECVRCSLSQAIECFCRIISWSKCNCYLELSKHYEEGARKYGEHNWEKGIPLHSYLDSSLRHLMKFMDGMHDEPHDRAFIWNIFGFYWTFLHHKDLIDL